MGILGSSLERNSRKFATPSNAQAPDLVDCGGAFDTALVLPNDRVRDNCEEVIDVSEITSVAPPSVLCTQ
jgi:hypothetical protein